MKEEKDGSTVSITTIRVDTDVKEEAASIFKNLGLSFNAGVEIYLRAVCRENKIPFELRLDASRQDAPRFDVVQ